MYRLCSAAKGLLLLPVGTAAAAWSELAVAFQEAPYSYARHRLAEVMLRASQARFEDEFAHDALWDCEEQMRELGCRWVRPLGASARARLQDLAADTRDPVHQRAAQRLSGAQMPRADG
jgi:hypothetical protein